ncbi:uncharacterized protein SAPINGB_P004067 [Magnusiomyces paraingens]|uniref:Meiotic sister chromatid recombination protein 1 n=1 Tax=Magnusiomyces paraingens TaxID=2606893 RepID=A0A5E8BTK6_9ASCO|nr:uncharacterized protein SAPINGB_P004067 [Saprochaete ingens]VVT54421.1 unnamed protein product [Saprochaete ingens]
MKFSQISILLFAVLAQSASLTPVDLSSWSKSDLQSFLDDFHVQYDASKDSVKDLASKAQAQWNSFALPYTSWSTPELQAYLDRKGIKYQIDAKAKNARADLEKLVARVYPDNVNFEQTAKEATASASKSASAAYDKVSGWLFDTWSLDELRTFVKKNVKEGINTSEASRKELVSAAQQAYDKHASKIKAENFYPGKWVFDGWSDKDLEQWLQKNKISIENKAGGAQKTLASHRNQLLGAVRKNARYAWLSAQDAHNSFLDSVGIVGADVYDKAKKIKDSVFDTWSDAQLSQWLESHGLNSKGLKHDALIKAARDNRDQLGRDISYYLDSASRTASPILDKAGEAAASVTDSVKNVDTNFNLWEPEKLNEFVSGVRAYVPAWIDDATRKLRSDGLWAHTQASNYARRLFDHWSSADLASWLRREGVEVDTTAANARDTLANRAALYLSTANKFSAEKYRQMSSRFSADFRKATDGAFENWSDDELRSWLTAKGNDAQKYAKSAHEELVKAARGDWGRSYVEGFSDSTRAGVASAGSAASAGASAVAGAAGAAAQAVAGSVGSAANAGAAAAAKVGSSASSAAAGAARAAGSSVSSAASAAGAAITGNPQPTGILANVPNAFWGAYGWFKERLRFLSPGIDAAGPTEL